MVATWEVAVYGRWGDIKRSREIPKSEGSDAGCLHDLKGRVNKSGLKRSVVIRLFRHEVSLPWMLTLFTYSGIM